MGEECVQGFMQEASGRRKIVLPIKHYKLCVCIYYCYIAMCKDVQNFDVKLEQITIK